MRMIFVYVILFLLSGCGGSDENSADTHNPKNLVVNIKINNGSVMATLNTIDNININEPLIDVRLNGESLVFVYSEIDNKAYYTGSLLYGQKAIFGIAMDNREYLVASIDMPGKIDESHVRVNILPNENLEISWDHLGKYNKIKLYKAILLNPYPILSEEPRITLAEDYIEYNVKIGKGEQMLPPEWLQVEEGRLYELVLDVESEYAETVSDVFHPHSKIEVRYDFEHHVDIENLQ